MEVLFVEFKSSECELALVEANVSKCLECALVAILGCWAFRGDVLLLPKGDC